MKIPEDLNSKQCSACGGVIPEESSLCPMCPDPRIAKLESELAQARAEIERLRRYKELTEPAYAEQIAHRVQAESERDSLRAQLEQMRKADRWIPVSERLPDAVDDYLVEIESARGLAKWRDVKTFADGKFHGMRCGDNVARWRPLPAAPRSRDEL